jgi:hypothetical protein
MRTLEHFHKYLYEQESHLCTDHSALTWLVDFKNLEGEIARWIQHLQEYNLTSKHRKGRQRYHRFPARHDVEEWCRHCDTCAARQGLMHQYNVGALFERIVIDIAGPFTQSDQGNQYLLIAVDYFTK